MLTNEVKQRINTCRDILVGKLPDPKSQVIQITNALIYKFMDDQDRLSEKMGGKASFFTGVLKPYAWHKLFDSKLTNQDRADLYVTGIEKLSAAENLPELFREIFKEAYMPFKAAGTITLFIEEINKFSYHHSEELGNAYEYLLSIMGSQGDAGQFRTPRHIIEFLVQIVDPQKNETVYDPAAGTAGFLIAAYNHIIRSNEHLSATEKRSLSKNISGVDIDPGMAKMARVNLYLHGFASPQIDEGDTLTDEDRWGKKYDVILANPPFMSPKGGIIPHDHFSFRSKKSELLFVDYISEHLKINGRAGIVVPDGVIANSPNQYSALRKKLVDENLLLAVVSLPAGIFLPYSDVKTTILYLDRKRSSNSDKILFIQIYNDGFELGSTRKAVIGSDVSDAALLLKEFKESIDNQSEYSIPEKFAAIANIESKENILQSPSISLSGKRYKKEKFVLSSYKSNKLGKYLKQEKHKVKDQIIPVWSVSNKQGFVLSADYFDKQVASSDISNYKIVKPNFFAYNPARINVGSVALNADEKYGCVSPMYTLFSIKDQTELLPEYLLAILKSKVGLKQILKYSDGAVRKILSFDNLCMIDIPVPSLKIQEDFIKHFLVINDYEQKISLEREKIRKEISNYWGVPEEEVMFDSDELNALIDSNDQED